MHPPTKTQLGIGVDNPRVDAAHGALIELHNGDLVENRNVTHEEFGQEADINHMLATFKIAPPRGAPTYGEWDDNIDLQTALETTREARTAWQRVPEELRRKFGSMEEMLRAVENGSLVLKDEEAPSPVIETPPAK